MTSIADRHHDYAAGFERLHHTDARYDDMNSDEFTAYLLQLDVVHRQLLANDLEARFHSYTQTSLHHRDTAALGLIGGQHSMSPEERMRRQSIGERLIHREARQEKIQALYVIALRESGIVDKHLTTVYQPGSESSI